MSLPTQIGRYEVLSLLGQGAMGAVYKAHDPVLDRVVAIKTVSPLLLATSDLRDEFLERFRREAKAAGRLSHPHIVSVYDLGLDEATATPFIVMEYVAGVSLETVLEENPALPFAQAMEIVEQVTSALDEAHRYGIVHRDIKPANIFLDGRGRVKVGDFGVARLEGSELTQTGVSLGTPGYLAPEVVRGGVADARSDVFALGVLAYRLFTGKRPFGGATRESLAIDLLEREPYSPLAVNPELPEHVSRAVMRALAKSPEERTPNAEAFLRDLRAPEVTSKLQEPSAGPSAGAPPITADSTHAQTPGREPVARGSRHWLLLATLMAVAFALAVGAFLVSRGSRAERAPSAAVPPMPTAAATRAQPTARQRVPTPPTTRDAGSPRKATSPAPIDPSRSGHAEDESGTYRPEDAAKVRESLREAQKKAEERSREELKRAQEEARERAKQAREKKKKENER